MYVRKKEIKRSQENEWPQSLQTESVNIVSKRIQRRQYITPDGYISLLSNYNNTYAKRPYTTLTSQTIYPHPLTTRFHDITGQKIIRYSYGSFT